MKPLCWDAVKNQKLIEERGIRFEEVLVAIEQGDLLNEQQHPNQEEYSHQRIFIVKIHEYVYMVPFVEDDEKIFLKTIIPSRKLTKQYLS